MQEGLTWSTAGKERGGPGGRVGSEMQGKHKEVLVAPDGALELSQTSVGEAGVPSRGTVMGHTSPGKACDLGQGRAVQQVISPRATHQPAAGMIALGPGPSSTVTRATDSSNAHGDRCCRHSTYTGHMENHKGPRHTDPDLTLVSRGWEAAPPSASSQQRMLPPKQQSPGHSQEPPLAPSLC